MFGSYHNERSELSADSLQADVMRFMAIIGFCLLAIMALVRNIEPIPPAVAMSPDAVTAPVAVAPAVLTPTEKSRPNPPIAIAQPAVPVPSVAVVTPAPRTSPEARDPVVQMSKVVASEGVAAPAENAQSDVEPQLPHAALVRLAERRAQRLATAVQPSSSMSVAPVAAIDDALAAAQPIEVPVPVPTPRSVEPPAKKQVFDPADVAELRANLARLRAERLTAEANQSEPVVTPEAVAPVIDQKTLPAVADPTEQGLVLRFADDRAFLGMLTTRQARLYALTEQGALELSLSAGFQASARPTQIREIAISSLPQSVQGQVPSGVTTVGVVFAPRIEHDIVKALDLALTGELLITRTGRVQHAAG